MAGKPDPKPARRLRPSERRRKAPSDRVAPCWGDCGRSVVPRHHLVPRDFTKPGPDDPWNIVPLCGSGTTGCHGAFHGSPYTFAGRRFDAKAVRTSIWLHFTRDETRRQALNEFLDTPELRYRFFTRVLGVRDDYAAVAAER